MELQLVSFRRYKMRRECSLGYSQFLGNEERPAWDYQMGSIQGMSWKSSVTASITVVLCIHSVCPHKVSLVGRHESNVTEHVNALLLGHLRRLVHDGRLVSKWASDIVLPLINNALATTPNSELGGLTPAELKFGTLDFQHFRMPQQLVPGHHYGDFVQQLDKNLSTVLIELLNKVAIVYLLTLNQSSVYVLYH